MAFLRPFRTLVPGGSIPRAAFVSSLALGSVVSALQAGDLSAREDKEGNGSIPKTRLSQRHRAQDKGQGATGTAGGPAAQGPIQLYRSGKPDHEIRWTLRQCFNAQAAVEVETLLVVGMAGERNDCRWATDGRRSGKERFYIRRANKNPAARPTSSEKAACSQ